MSRSKLQSISTGQVDPSIEGVHIPTPPLVFIETPLSLGDLLDQHSLPRVIKCETTDSFIRDELRCNLDIHQPMLAFMKRSVRKVSAHSLQYDINEGDFVTVGNGILIPEDYPGWFAVLGSPNEDISYDQRIPHYTTISCLATSGCCQFLIGGNNSVHGFLKHESDKTRAINCQIPPGTVLRRVGLYQEDKTTTTKESKKKNKMPDMPQRKFLKCSDRQNRDIFIPVNQKGVFYVISKDDRSHPVMQIKDILKRFSFPVMVKLLYGRIPATPCAFTQVLLLTDSGINHTLVASTLLCYRNINLEIPLDTKLKFYAADNTDVLLTSKAYVNALNTCKDKVPSYITDMKVVFGNSELSHDNETSIKSNQQEMAYPTNKSVPKSNDKSVPKSVPNNALPASPETFPTMRAALSVNNGPIKKCSVRESTNVSYLSCMIQKITMNEDSFILPSSKPVSNKLSSISKDNIHTPSKMSLVTIYDPPNPHKEGDIISIEKGESQLKNTDSTICYRNQTRDPSDNESSLPSASSSVPATDKSVIPSDSLQANTMSNQDETNIYFTSWIPNRSSAITIPSKPGQPVISLKTPIINQNDCDYLPMHPKTPLEKPPKPCSKDRTVHTSPIISEESQLSQFKSSIKSSESDSSVSATEDDWSTYDEDMDSSRLAPVDTTGNRHSSNQDQKFLQHEHSLSNNTVMYVGPNKHCYNTKSPAVVSTFTCNNEINEYLDVLDSIPTQTNIYNEARTSGHYYSLLDSCGNKTDNIYDNEYGNQLGNSNDTMDTFTAESQANSGPQLPPRHNSSDTLTAESGPQLPPRHNSSDTLTAESGPQLPPRHNSSDTLTAESGPQLPPRHNSSVGHQPATLGQVVMKSIPQTSNFTFGQINKNMLLMELRKAGIKPTVEMAFASLQWADITYLLSRDDDFDDTLIELLPQVGKIDLKRLAICLRGIKVSI